MATKASFVTVSKNDIPIYEAEVGASPRGFQVIISKMSGSVAENSDLTYSSLGDQLPTVTIQTESSCVQGINNEESTGESSKEHVGSMVGWTVYKKYGIRAVKGVVESYNSETKIYDVHYKDGKSEKVTADNLVRYLSPCRPGSEQPRASPLRINAQNASCLRPARKPAKRTRDVTATAQQSRPLSRGSAAGQMPTADSGSEGKKRYKSLRMNAGR